MTTLMYSAAPSQPGTPSWTRPAAPGGRSAPPPGAQPVREPVQPGGRGRWRGRQQTSASTVPAATSWQPTACRPGTRSPDLADRNYRRGERRPLTSEANEYQNPFLYLPRDIGIIGRLWTTTTATASAPVGPSSSLSPHSPPTWMIPLPQMGDGDLPAARILRRLTGHPFPASCKPRQARLARHLRPRRVVAGRN